LRLTVFTTTREYAEQVEQRLERTATRFVPEQESLPCGRPRISHRSLMI
jgi:hypothetical protein